MMIKKLKNTILSIDVLNQLLSNKLFKFATKSEIGVSYTHDVMSGKVLVLAPHPDDETLGCGGAILKHVKNNDRIKIIFFTDGSSGFPDGFRASDREKREMVKIRAHEAKEAAQILSVSDLTFLNYKDGGLSANKRNISFLTQLIIEYAPDVIYVPAVNDPNPDHSEVANIFSKSIINNKNKMQIFQYEVWSTIIANTILNIDTEITKKQEVISVYKSQLKCRDYLSAIVGLNNYRGAISGKSKYAEAFFRSDVDFFNEYYKLSSKKLLS